MRYLVLAIAISGHAAFAQAPGEASPLGQTSSMTSVVGHDSPRREHKTVLRAYLVTLGAFSLPLLAGGFVDFDQRGGARGAVAGSLGIAGMMLGPSAGHWYAHEAITTGLVIRMVGLGGIAALAVADPHMDHAATVVGVMGALGVIETGIVWDLVTLPRAVRRFDRAHELHLAPLVGTQTTGLAFGGEF